MSEALPTTCASCGADEELEVRRRRDVDGDAQAATRWYAVCRRCLREEFRQTVAAQAAHWQGVADGTVVTPLGGPAEIAARVRLIAESLRAALATEGVEPDDATAAFITRYAPRRVVRRRLRR